MPKLMFKFFEFLLAEWNGQADLILSNQETILQNQIQQKELLMAIKDQVVQLAQRIDAATNTLAGSIQKVGAIIAELQARIKEGTITPEELTASLDPVAVNLEAVSKSLEAICAGGTTEVPATEPL